jgi:hypothetical protein
MEGAPVSEVLGEYVLPIVVMAFAIIFASVILFATRTKKITHFKERASRTTLETSVEEAKTDAAPTPSIRVKRSVPSSQVNQAKEELRILSLEKEIVGFALTRLYEAEADGKITKEDQVKLLEKYGTEMKQLDKQITTKEMIVKLYELEGTQSELIQLFNNRLDEINREIKTIRGSLGLEPVEELPPEEVKPPTPASAKEQSEKKPPRRRAPSKTDAEQKLEAIQDEVLKVLERLEQIETEA